MTGNKYDASSTIINSSFSDRCIMSTQALLAGFYPPGKEGPFYPELNWQPVPIHYTPRHLDQVYSKETDFYISNFFMRF